MKVEVKFICDDAEEAATILARLDARTVSAAAGTETEKAKRTRKSKDTEAQPAPAAAPAAAAAPAVDPSNLLGLPPSSADPLAALLNGNSAGQLPPVSTPAPAPVAIAPAPVAAPALTQQDVIKAFVALGQAPGKGPDAIRAVLAPLGAATVTAIAPAQYAQAVEAVKAALAK